MAGLRNVAEHWVTYPMLYKIRCNPVHPLNGALPGLYVPVRVTHQYTYAEPCSTAGLLSLLGEQDLLTAHSMVWDGRFQDSKSRANASLLA